MKVYNSGNFFKHTFCEFHQTDDFIFPEKTNYKSKSNSKYYYTNDGVYRKSNHWGRVANCRWKLITNNNYKNQEEVIGFAKWGDFLPINSTKKNFFIEVNFNLNSAKLKPNNYSQNKHLFTYTEAIKRVKKVKYLLKNDSWADYFDIDSAYIKHKLITAFINSDMEFSALKIRFK